MCVIGISCETKEATSLFKIWKKRSNRRVQVLMTPKPVTLYISDRVHIITKPTQMESENIIWAIWYFLTPYESVSFDDFGDLEFFCKCWFSTKNNQSSHFTPFDYYYEELHYVLLFLMIIFESVWKVGCLKRRFSNKRFQFIC